MKLFLKMVIFFPCFRSLFGYVHEIETEVLENRKEMLSEPAASDIKFDQNIETFTAVRKYYFLLYS